MLHSESFEQLLQIEDPFRYLNSADAARLAIPKYIINASGDDFFVPDNTRYYLAQLPGIKTLRVAPNSDHYGIGRFVESSLTPLVNRIQQGHAMPTMQLTETQTEQGAKSWQLNFSEKPVKIVQWTANNPVARDFRLACGIRYRSTDIAAGQQVSVNLSMPAQGWQSSFVEAQFADGFVMTSQVQILPDSYPTTAPPETAPYCKTL